MEQQKLEEIKHIHEYGKEMFNLAIDNAILVIEKQFQLMSTHEGFALSNQLVSKLQSLKK